MAGRGRPNKYYTNVEPYLDDISEMALNMTEKDICKELGVGITAWCDYKKKYPKLSEALKRGRKELVKDLRSTLIKKAKGFNYEEKRIVRDEEGVVVKQETYIKASLPDVAAINLALKNYDPDNWSNDPQRDRLRERELELKELHMEMTEW